MNNNNNKKIVQNILKNIIVGISYLFFVWTLITIPILLNTVDVLHFSDLIHFLLLPPEDVDFPLEKTIIIHAITTLWFLICWYQKLIRLYYVYLFIFTGKNHVFMLSPITAFVETSEQLYLYLLKNPKETWFDYLIPRILALLVYLANRLVLVFWFFGMLYILRYLT